MQDTSSGAQKVPDEDHGPIFRITETCRQNLAQCVQVEELMKSKWAENRLADFNLWASGIGALARNRASLDHRLAQKPDARDIILTLLRHLSSAVLECRALGQSNDQSQKPTVTGI